MLELVSGADKKYSGEGRSEKKIRLSEGIGTRSRKIYRFRYRKELELVLGRSVSTDDIGVRDKQR